VVEVVELPSVPAVDVVVLEVELAGVLDLETVYELEIMARCT
jgi:hypothetical protein